MTTSTGLPGFPTIVAHRGLKGAQHIENTVPAFRAAIAAHADMIELDIHETKDGQLIVYHNNARYKYPALEPTTFYRYPKAGER